MTIVAVEPGDFVERLTVLMPFAVSFALGALIGLERQRSEAAEPRSLPGGIRTFPLIGLLGCTAAWLATQFGAAAFITVAAGFSLILAVVYYVSSRNGDIGMTTEVAAFLTFLFGAMVYQGAALLASALAVATTVALAMRKPLHEWAGKIDQSEFYATLQLAVLSLIILPLLPNEEYGPEPYRIFNPYVTWLLVIFIAGMSFVGYIGIKLLGARRGLLAAGLLGGMVSSTAVTLSFADRSRRNPHLASICASAILLSWLVMVFRALVEVAVVNRALVDSVAVPLLSAAAAGAACVGFLLWRGEKPEQVPEVAHHNPFSLKSALTFGLLFLLVLFVARTASLWFADAGVIASGALAGMVEIDAITLSASRLSATGEIAPRTAQLTICAALASNTVVKTIIAAVLGVADLRRAVFPVSATMLATGAAALWLVG